MLNQDNDDWNEGRLYMRSSNKTTTLTPSQSNENKQTLWENSREWKNYMIFPFHHFYFNFTSMQTVNVISPDSYLMHEYSSKNMSYAICSGLFLLYPTPIFNVCKERLFRFYVPTVLMVAMMVCTVLVLVLLYVVSIWISICVCIRIVVSFANPATVSAAIFFCCSSYWLDYT